MSDAEIITVDPTEDDRWRALVQARPSDLFHSPEWLGVVSTTYGLEPRALVVLRDDLPVAGVPYVEVGGPAGRRICTPPFSDFCDPITDDSSEWRLMLSALSDLGATIKVRSLHSDIAPRAHPEHVVDRAMWHGLDLAADLDTIWGDLHGSARRAIRKAGKEGVVVRRATTVDDLRAFFELHLRIRKYKYRLLAQPYRFFEEIWRVFMERNQGWLLVARHDDAMIGGVLLLRWKDRLYYKFNASDPDSANLRPNDLAIWTGIELAKAQGLSRLDFGLSGRDQEGLIRYKQKYASEERTISFLRFENGSDEAAAASTRRMLPRLTDLFTDERVPDEITEEAGALLYRHFA